MSGKNAGKTVREPSPADATQREPSGSETVPEGTSTDTKPSPPQPHPQPLQPSSSFFRGYRLIKQRPSTNTQADIFLAEKNGKKYVLKLYHYGITPKREIMQAMKMLGEKYPEDFVRIYDADFDPQSKRWYEIQEFVKYPSLQIIISNSKRNPELRSKVFRLIAQEVGSALNILHENNILHLDIKPDNILVRSTNPFSLMLIDFGIASILQADMSKKFTTIRGTPMYQSPESWVGAVGKASDWWGLGMILLEVAAGKHPFDGLSINVIALNITTRPIEIPDTLAPDMRELLRGLLTKDPANRWNWEQVSRWLKGERGIGDKFEGELVQTHSSIKPLEFMGKKCCSLEDFSREAVQNEESWEKGKIFLLRGYLRQWLEGNSDFDLSVEIDNMLSDVQDDDEKLARLIQKFGKDIPLVFCGHLITFKNLFMLAAKAFKHEKMTPLERKITASIDDGVLVRLIEKFDSPSPELDALAKVLKKLARQSWAYQAGFLELYTFPERFYCPFADDVSDIDNLIEETADIHEVPMRLTDWQETERKYFIPPNITARIQRAEQYTSAVHELERLKKSGGLLPRAVFTDEEAELIQRELLPYIKPEHQSLEFIDFYLHPLEYYFPFWRGKESFAEAEKLKYPPEFLSEWQRLESKYILPKELTDKTLSAETYHEAMSQIIRMEADGKLAIRKGNY